MHSPYCAECGSPLDPGVPDGHCLVCLARLGEEANATNEAQLAFKAITEAHREFALEPAPARLSENACEWRGHRKSDHLLVTLRLRDALKYGTLSLEDYRKRSLLVHSDIARLHAFGEENRFHFTIIDRPEGRYLDEILVDPLLSPTQLDFVRRRVRAALEHAESLGIHLTASQGQIILRKHSNKPILLAIDTAPDKNDDRFWLEEENGQVFRLQNYRIIRRIGEGGFAEVYLAEQLHPVRRLTALKVLKTDRADQEHVELRFAAERQLMASLAHPNIAQVYDAGCTKDGQPYFSMEFVDGEPITTFCRRRNLGLKEILTLFGTVCEAVQHAHNRNIIHRDLKPSNILVSSEGESVLPKVIDFGIARAINRPLTGETLYTKAYYFVGSPDYMSPEQFDGGIEPDARVDVYALGCILFELITGGAPRSAAALRELPLTEVIRRIREEPVAPPSKRLLDTTEPPLEGGKAGWVNACQNGLDSIVARALERDRSKRFESVEALRSAVETFLKTGSFRMKREALQGTLLPALLCVAAVGLISFAVIAWTADKGESEKPTASVADANEYEPSSEVIEPSINSRSARLPFSGKKRITPVALYNLNGTFASSLDGGAPLAPHGDPETTFLTEESPSGMTNFVRLPAFEPVQWLSMANPIGPNGDLENPKYTNHYTLVFDVRFPDLEGPAALFQGNVNNSNDAEVFAGPDGISFNKSGTRGLGRLKKATWHRIAVTLSQDNTTAIIRIFIDGTALSYALAMGDANPDGRFALEDQILLFADSGGKTATLDLASLALYDYPLSREEIRLLGTTQPDGIPLDVSVPRDFLSPVALYQFNHNLFSELRLLPPIQLSPSVPARFEEVTIAGQPAVALRVPVLRPTEYLKVSADTAPNGPPGMLAKETNFFSLVMDVCIPSLRTPVALFSLGSDQPAAVCVLPDGSLCDYRGRDGHFRKTEAGHIQEGRWHRVAIVGGGTASFPVTTCYVDGKPLKGSFQDRIYDHPAYVLDDDEPFLFSCAEGRTGPVLVNSAAVLDMALMDEEVAALGAASTDGIPGLIGLLAPKAAMHTRMEKVHVRSAPQHEVALTHDTESGRPSLVSFTKGWSWEEWQRFEDGPWEPLPRLFRPGQYSGIIPSGSQTANLLALDVEGALHILTSNKDDQAAAARWAASPLPVLPSPVYQTSSTIDSADEPAIVALRMDDQISILRREKNTGQWAVHHPLPHFRFKRASLHRHPGDERLAIFGIDLQNRLVVSYQNHPNAAFESPRLVGGQAASNLLNYDVIDSAAGQWEVFLLDQEGHLSAFRLDAAGRVTGVSIALEEGEIFQWIEAYRLGEAGTVLLAPAIDGRLGVRIRSHGDSWTEWTYPGGGILWWRAVDHKALREGRLVLVMTHRHKASRPLMTMSEFQWTSTGDWEETVIETFSHPF